MCKEAFGILFLGCDIRCGVSKDCSKKTYLSHYLVCGFSKCKVTTSFRHGNICHRNMVLISILLPQFFFFHGFMDFPIVYLKGYSIFSYNGGLRSIHFLMNCTKWAVLSRLLLMSTSG